MAAYLERFDLIGDDNTFTSFLAEITQDAEAAE
jgi:hypothetical protein